MDCGGRASRKRKVEAVEATVRHQANARERDRTHRSTKLGLVGPRADRGPHKDEDKALVNSAFSMVRTLIPTEPPDRKLSKIEILRLATSYIAHLQCQLMADKGEEQPCARLQIGSWQEARLPVCTFCLASQKKMYQRAPLPPQDSRFLPCPDTPGPPPPWLLRPLCDINCRHSALHDLQVVPEDLRRPY